jgi:hypothetical protein
MTTHSPLLPSNLSLSGNLSTSPAAAPRVLLAILAAGLLLTSPPYHATDV